MFLTLLMPRASDAAIPQQDSASVAARVDTLYFGTRPEESLALCEAIFATRTDEPELRWRAARAAIALGMLRPDGAERRLLYDRALRHARRALELAPGEVTARYWLAAAAGRRAHRDDPMLSARLAATVYEQASAILATDSTHAGAHHVMGLLHAEVSRVPATVRLIAVAALGVDFARRANVRDAERHLRVAVSRDPEMLLYLADLVAFYDRVGRREEASFLAARLTALPQRHPFDSRLQTRHSVSHNPG